MLPYRCRIYVRIVIFRAITQDMCFSLDRLNVESRRFVDVTKSSRSEWMQMIPTSEKIKKTAEDLEEPILK